MAGKGTRGVVLVGVAATLAAVALYVATRAEAAPIYTCPYCGAEFATQEELNQHILIAHPQAPPVPGTYYLSIYKVGNGTVTPESGDYSAGATVTLTAIPDAGAVFDHWEGAAIGTSTTVNILMDGDKEVTAYFATEVIPTATIYGMVTDAETGYALAGVKVTLPMYAKVTRTDSNGNYRFEEPTLDNDRIIFEKSGYETRVINIDLSQGDNELNVSLSPVAGPPVSGFIIRGTVSDTSTGLAIPGATVYAALTGQPPFTSTLTDQYGYYEFRVYLNGVFARKTGYYDSQWVVWFPKVGTYTVNFELQPK